MMFSVIVPIYKVEEYLPQCIESVLNQSYDEFELILVDDGSPDKSGIICDEYALKDNRIRVLHKTNGGVSDARNIGMSIAIGEYIWFLDSDDYMTQSAMNSIADIIHKNHHIDMITCAHINDYCNGNKELISLPYNSLKKNMNRDEYIHILYKSNGAYWDAWKNIYKRIIIKKNNLQFKSGLVCAEDCDFFIRFIFYSEQFLCINIPILHYRINRDGSVTNTMSKAAIIDQLTVFKDCYKIFQRDNDYRNQDMKIYFSNKFANTISLLHHLKTNIDINEVTTYIKDYIWILNDTKGTKYNVAKFVWLLFGYYKGSKVLQNLRLKNKN